MTGVVSPPAIAMVKMVFRPEVELNDLEISRGLRVMLTASWNAP